MPSIPYILLSIFGCILTILAIKKLYCGINESKWTSLNTPQKCISFSVCLSFFFLSLYGLSMAVLKIVEFTTPTRVQIHSNHHKFLDVKYRYVQRTIPSKINLILLCCAIFSIQCWWISMYLHAVLRLIDIFKDTQYFVNIRTVKCYILSLLFTIIGIGALVTLERTSYINQNLSLYLQIMSVSPTAFCGIHLVYQFNSKLLELIAQEKEFQFDESMERLLSAAIKHTIVGNFIIFFIFNGIVMTGLYAMARSYHNLFNNLWFDMGFDMIIDSGIAAASYSAYLGLSPNKSQYLCCCGVCDRRLKRKEKQLLQWHLRNYI